MTLREIAYEEAKDFRFRLLLHLKVQMPFVLPFALKTKKILLSFFLHSILISIFIPNNASSLAGFVFGDFELLSELLEITIPESEFLEEDDDVL